MPNAAPIRILIVDDEDVPRQRLRAALDGAGHEVLESADGEEALRTLDREPIDLVITDVVMPDLDGIELLRTLRKEHPGVRTIVLSASDYSQDEIFLTMARLLGAVAAFRKSVDPKRLLEVVRDVAARVTCERQASLNAAQHAAETDPSVLGRPY
jgi:CheY-like chemotaxis protein